MKWTEKEEKIVIEEYAKGKKKELENKLNRSWTSIQCKASKLGIKKEIVEIKNNDLSIWSEDEINILKTNYFNEDELLKKLPGRSLSSIYNKAFILGLKKYRKKDGDLSVLLKENCISYYWIGFLMADGHFSNKGVVQVNLAKKDLNHLKKLSKFLKHKKELIKPNLSIGDAKNLNKIKEKFDIKNNKTYFPCNIKDIKNEDLLFSLIIGFIDGDGSIKESGGSTGLYIRCHSSWKDNLQIFIDFLCRNEDKKYTTIINRSGLASTWITDLIILKNIKTKAIELKLPILKRKWDNINLNKKNKKEISREILENCVNLFEKNKTPIEVIEQTNYSSSVIYKNFGIWKKKNNMDREING